ncbi:Methyltransferase domain-containing protein [Aquimarina spongiae]|uniref:Methyltransferase domain-containing protein n=1 Tax=Aquimarina spongiae TaxID=570521 RepID=A0A1M6FC63_9FLAO|nr:class I SAM-dependent methyltransferase [Aquimarina spongiae]SHI95236.1 Methyltransferase domain-containing protein [Aquimarina spongiae]
MEEKKQKEEQPIFVSCKDHTVSGETFHLISDTNYDMLVTTPKPKEEDLGKYYESEDYISHTDNKRSLFEKVYHLVKSYALRKKVGLITKLNNGSGTILDIGAGTGDFLSKAKNGGWTVSGIEPNEQAKQLAQQKEVLLHTKTDEFEDHSFDIITLWHVLEHVPDLQHQIQEIKRLLKPGGYVIVAVPNFKSYDATHYKSFWAAFDVPRHLWHFSKNAIQKLFAEQGLNLTQTLPMHFDAYYVSLLSEKYKTSKMNFLSAFWIGFRSNIKAIRSKEYSSHVYVLKNS